MPLPEQDKQAFKAAAKKVPAGLYMHMPSRSLYLTRGPSVDQTQDGGEIKVPYWPVRPASDGVNHHHRSVADFTELIQTAEYHGPRFIQVCSWEMVDLVVKAMHGPQQ